MNILFLMSDQHRADHVGCHPRARLSTPNIDRLAEGTVFQDCVSVNPICTPARAMHRARMACTCSPDSSFSSAI